MVTYKGQKIGYVLQAIFSALFNGHKDEFVASQPSYRESFSPCSRNGEKETPQNDKFKRMGNIKL